MNVRHLFGALALCVCAISLNGCGNGSSPSNSQATNTSKPLTSAVKVSDPGQITGLWMGITSGPFQGMEFRDNGEAIMTSHGGSAATIKYEVLDGGRLSLVRSGGRTQVVSVKVAGDVLEMTVGNTMERFRRVPEGQTLHDALAAFHKQQAAEREKKLAAVRAALNQKNLVLVPTKKTANAKPLILQLAQVKGTSFQGTGTFDYPKMKPMNFLMRGSIAIAQDQRATVTINIVQARYRQGTQPQRLSVELRPADDSASPSLAGTLTMKGNKVDCELKVDPAAHKALADHLAAIKKAREDAIATITKPLGERALITGTQTLAQRQNQKLAVTLILQHTAGGSSYTGTMSTSDQPMSGKPVLATVQLINKKPYLMVTPSNGQVWQLTLKDKALTGPFGSRYSNTAQGALALHLDRSWDAQQLAARKAAIAKYVKNDLQTPHTYRGMIQFPNGSTPVWVQLQTVADGTVSGEMYFPLVGGGDMTFAGQVKDAVDGPQIQLQGTRVKGTRKFLSDYSRQQWAFVVDRIDPRAKLAGTGKIGLKNVHLILTPIDDATAAKELATIQDTLKDAMFELTSSRGNPKSTPPLNLVWLTLDPATKKLTGEITGDAYIDTVDTPSFLEGTIKTDHTFAIINLDAQVRVGSPINHAYQFMATVKDGKVHLDGEEFINTTFHAGHITLTPTDRKPNPPTKALVELTAMRHHAYEGNRIPGGPKAGQVIYVMVKGTTRGRVYGTGTYTYDSNMAAAAVQAGLLKSGELGVVQVTYSPALANYVGSTANGVTSKSYPAAAKHWRGTSYTLKLIPTETPPK